jgi:SAM-dependent methyltransferase
MDYSLSTPYAKLSSILTHYFPSVEINKKLSGLDIGCGYGRHTKLLYEMGFQTTALDYHHECISKAKEWINTTDINFLACDFSDFSSPTQFDVIVAWHFIYAYNKTQQDFLCKLENIYNLLKEGGHLFISFRSKNNTILTDSSNSTIDGFVYDNEKYNTSGYVFLDFNEINTLLNSFGFIITHMALEENHYCDGYTTGSPYWLNNWENTKLDYIDSWWNIVAIKN